MGCTTLGEEIGEGLSVGVGSATDDSVAGNFIARFPLFGYTQKLLPQ
jgi:hypothetical protein